MTGRLIYLYLFQCWLRNVQTESRVALRPNTGQILMKTWLDWNDAMRMQKTETSFSVLGHSKVTKTNEMLCWVIWGQSLSLFTIWKGRNEKRWNVQSQRTKTYLWHTQPIMGSMAIGWKCIAWHICIHVCVSLCVLNLKDT